MWSKIPDMNLEPLPPQISPLAAYIFGADKAIQLQGGPPLTLAEISRYGIGGQGYGSNFQHVTIGELLACGEALKTAGGLR